MAQEGGFITYHYYPIQEKNEGVQAIFGPKRGWKSGNTLTRSANSF